MATQEERDPTVDPRRSYVIKKARMDIVVFTDVFMIEGTAHFIPRARLSDFMNRTDINFVPLTAAVVYNREDGAKVFESDFLCLNKSDITILSPKQDMS